MHVTFALFLCSQGYDNTFGSVRVSLSSCITCEQKFSGTNPAGPRVTQAELVVLYMGMFHVPEYSTETVRMTFSGKPGEKFNIKYVSSC